uniref:Uncharacterized protein n=1 Tax=Rhizobium rhizogenes TaxID=359 RepID=A0A7S4ZUR6_RHIRH|nr:hypothetical protein pC6.5c_637 [Rhizobium rhizogenes]
MSEFCAILTRATPQFGCDQSLLSSGCSTIMTVERRYLALLIVIDFLRVWSAVGPKRPLQD